MGIFKILTVGLVTFGFYAGITAAKATYGGGNGQGYLPEKTGVFATPDGYDNVSNHVLLRQQYQDLLAEFYQLQQEVAAKATEVNQLELTVTSLRGQLRQTAEELAAQRARALALEAELADSVALIQRFRQDYATLGELYHNEVAAHDVTKERLVAAQEALEQLRDTLREKTILLEAAQRETRGYLLALIVVVVLVLLASTGGWVAYRKGWLGRYLTPEDQVTADPLNTQITADPVMED